MEIKSYTHSRDRCKKIHTWLSHDIQLLKFLLPFNQHNIAYAPEHKDSQPLFNKQVHPRSSLNSPCLQMIFLIKMFSTIGMLDHLCTSSPFQIPVNFQAISLWMHQTLNKTFYNGDLLMAVFSHFCIRNCLPKQEVDYHN